MDQQIRSLEVTTLSQQQVEVWTNWKAINSSYINKRNKSEGKP